MSTGSAPRHAGFTILEVVVTIGLLTIMVVIMEGTIDSTRRAERRLAATRLVTERSERVTYTLLDNVNASHRIFSDGAIGTGYMGALDLSRLPILPSARLPRIDETHPLGPDAAGDVYTGNVLLLVREAAAAPAISDAVTSGVRSIDLYRFVCVYPRQTTRRLILDAPVAAARDLVLWRSVRYANHAQILDIDDPDERRSVVADLVNRFGIDHAWDLEAAVTAAFYPMDALGTLSASATPDIVIEEEPDAGEGGLLLAANVQLAPTKAGDFHRRSLMTSDPVASWTPGGFEIKIAGISGSRRVWMHLVLESPGGKGVVGVVASTVIASPRDL